MLRQVTEAAFTHRARAAGYPMHVPISKKQPDLRETTFKACLAWMSQQGHLTPAAATAGKGRRPWRTYGSHRVGQDIPRPP
jgi:hypothetical protein